jgi:hypothetical protein
MLFAVRVMGHDMLVTHADGQPVVPVTTRVAILGMGERLDVLVDANHPGVWPITAFGQNDQRVSAVLRYDGVRGQMPDDTGNEEVRPGDVLAYTQLSGALLDSDHKPDRKYELELSGGMMDGRHWTINGREYPDAAPMKVHQGERIRLTVGNMSMVPHPVHLHGHFFQLREMNGELLRRPILKDTIMVGQPAWRWSFATSNTLSRQHLGGPDIALPLLQREIDPVATHREPSPPEIGRRIVEADPAPRRPAGQGHGPEAGLASCVVGHVVHQPAVRRPGNLLRHWLGEGILDVNQRARLTAGRRDDFQ